MLQQNCAAGQCSRREGALCGVELVRKLKAAVAHDHEELPTCGLSVHQCYYTDERDRG
jgi:hypothetical protein